MTARLAVVGDVHGNLAALQEVLMVAQSRGSDGLLFVGDLAPMSSHSSKQAVIESVLAEAQATHIPYLWVPGNHDLPGLMLAGNVDRRQEALCGLRVVGLGGAGPARFGFPYEWSDAEILELHLPQADIVVSHTPPLETGLDRTSSGRHVGSAAIRAIALEHSGVLVCGHIHEAAGVDRLADCICLNAGAIGGPFARSQIGWIDWQEQQVRLVHEDLPNGQRAELKLHIAPPTA